MSTTKAWYIRSLSREETKGPFPAGQISQEILLGRYELDDEVSHDKEEWLVINEVPELVPSIFNDNPNAPDFNERLAAARRWADERRGIESDENSLSEERREKSSYENEEIKRLRDLTLEGKKKNNPVMTFIQVVIAFVVISSVVMLAFQFSPKDKSESDCSVEAKQGINWSGCNLSGMELQSAQLVAANLMNVNLQTANLHRANLTLANLKYAQLHLTNLKYVDFEKADLTGASLLGADLSGASFKSANLSYANFRDAIILTTDFTMARLDHAIWVDGRVCKVPSIGYCN